MVKKNLQRTPQNTRRQIKRRTTIKILPSFVQSGILLILAHTIAPRLQNQTYQNSLACMTHVTTAGGTDGLTCLTHSLHSHLEIKQTRTTTLSTKAAVSKKKTISEELISVKFAMVLRAGCCSTYIIITLESMIIIDVHHGYLH